MSSKKVDRNLTMSQLTVSLCKKTDFMGIRLSSRRIELDDLRAARKCRQFQLELLCNRGRNKSSSQVMESSLEAFSTDLRRSQRDEHVRLDPCRPRVGILGINNRSGIRQFANLSALM